VDNCGAEAHLHLCISNAIDLSCFIPIRVGHAGTELSRVTEEFNEMFGGGSNEVSWHWFFPLPVEFPRGMHKVVMGFEWDETFDAVPYEEPHGNGDVEMGTTTMGDRTSASARAPTKKEKSSEHENPDDPIIISPAGNPHTFLSDPSPSARGGPAKLVKRGNSRDRFVHKNDDPPLQGTMT
jgi:hypothetical protein